MTKKKEPKKTNWYEIKDIRGNPYLSQDQVDAIFYNVPPAYIFNYIPHFQGFGMSPTDKDSKGRYSYQEPEVDEQGTYYGYKVLTMCTCGCGQVRSPRYPVQWDENGELQADREPSVDTVFGVHCTKRPDHPELGNYVNRNPYAPHYPGREISILVKCALSGTIVETEQGFRAEHAQIIAMMEIGEKSNGYWTSYQDYKKYAQANSRRNSIYENPRWDSDKFTF